MKATQVSSQTIQEVQTVTCVICGNKTEGYYGRWGNTGTCSRKCENEQIVRITQSHEILLAALREKGL